MIRDARRRHFDTLVVWRLDRLGRSLRHLVNLLHDLDASGVSFVALNQNIDTTTAAGNLQLHMLAAIAEYERAMIQDRIRAGLARVRANGVTLGRPKPTVAAQLKTVAGLSHATAAERLGVSVASVKRWRRGSKTPARRPDVSPAFVEDSQGIDRP